MFVLKSGKDGNTALVNDLGELHTFSTTQDVIVRRALSAQSYFVQMPIVNLTSASISYVFYMQNNDTVPWVIVRILPRYGTSVGGAGDFTTQTILNPTGGTLLSATDFFAANLDLSNQVPLPGTFKYGAEGLNAVGGAAGSPTLVPENLNFENPETVILRPGSGFAVGVTPPAGNTSMNVQLSYELFRDT